jgi:hypothetical protein
MPKTTPKRKNKSRKKYAARILRESPGKKGAQTQKNRAGLSYPGSNSDKKTLAKIAKTVGSSHRRLAFKKKLEKLTKGISDELKKININESGNGDVVVKVNYTPSSSSSQKGGGKKKTKKIYQKETKNYKIEIIKKKPLTIQVYDWDKKKKKWVKEGKPTKIKKGGRRTKKRALKKKTRRKKN